MILAEALEHENILMHPFVLGELACGSMKNRREVLRLLSDLPGAPVATDPEVLNFIDRHTLMGRGLGYVDVHLLAAVALAGAALLWTRDKRLAAVARDLKLQYTGHP